MPIKIDKDIPIPHAINRPRSRTEDWPVDSMEVGDSFAVPVKDRRDARLLASCATRRFGIKRLQYKCLTRVFTEDGQLVLRIWRKS